MIGLIGKSARIVALVVCPVGLRLAASAQDATYSADSLMSVFKPGSQISLKGATIMFSGEIAEINRSRLIFKSSGNDRVICELVSPANRAEPYVVGHHVTVVGKVRGRGLLGNVTLDQCSPITPEASSVAPDVSPEEPVTEVLEETPPLAEPNPAMLPVPAAAAPAPGSAPAGRAGAARTHEDPVLPKGSEPSSPAGKSSEPMKGSEQLTQVIVEASDASNAYLQGVLHTLAAIVTGLIAVLAFVKLRPVLARSFQSTPKALPTEETRRAALEKLLSKQQKNKH